MVASTQGCPSTRGWHRVILGAPQPYASNNHQRMLNLIKNGNIDELKRWIQKEESPLYQELVEATIFSNHLNILEFVLQHEKESQAPREYHYDLIINYADNNVIDVLEILLQYAEDRQVANALQSAIKSGNQERLQNLLSAGANINAGDGLALLQAVESNQLLTLQNLILAKANVNTSNGQRALSTAVKKGCCVMVRSFLNAGADLNAPGSTALLDAVGNNNSPQDDHPINTDILYELLQTAPNLQIQNECGDTPLHLAAAEVVIREKIEPFIMLWTEGADLFVQNHQHKSPLDILKESSPEVLLKLEKEGMPLKGTKIMHPHSHPQQIQKKHCQKQLLPTRGELLDAVRQHNINKIKGWNAERKFHSADDLGLALIEAMKRDYGTIARIFLEQNQQLLLPEHREEAVRIAATKNLTKYITALIPINSNETAALRHIASIAAAKAGHRKLAQEMSDHASVPSVNERESLENATRHGRNHVISDEPMYRL